MMIFDSLRGAPHPVILKQNHIAEGDNRVICFGNFQNCVAILKRAADCRPYGFYRRLCDKFQFENESFSCYIVLRVRRGADG